MNAYIRLMRLDKPIGSLLLLWPTYWALFLSADGWPDLDLLIIFTLGVVVMRSAGCVINDYDDQDDCDRHDGVHHQGSQLVTPQSLASDQISKNLTFLWASFASRPTDRFFIIMFYFIINIAIIFFNRFILICWSGLQASSLLTD